MSFFVYQPVAERYAKYRPYFHPLVIEKIKTYLQIQRSVDLAVDVGCGSGQSTVALKEIADLVVGVDLSAEMLHFALRKAAVTYLRAAAEDLAIKSQSCDLVTTSLAYHWFNQDQFFAEVRRVLKASAWLVISNNWFTGQMKNEPEFQRWFDEVYEKRYPSPQRNSTPMTPEVAQRYGFDFAHYEDYENEVHFTVENMAAYLITQSNVIAATEQGNEKVENVYQWLVTHIRPFFSSEEAVFTFGGYLWYLQKVS